MLTIVDYGVGNLASMQNMLKKIGVPSKITSEKKDLEEADRLILPGVGAFDTCAEKLQQSGLIETLTYQVMTKQVPVLGVCVGMQLLLKGSEEGMLPGLGWIEGHNVKFRQDQLPERTKIPHMGWTDVVPRKVSGLLNGLEQESRFYFVHSYHALLTNEQDVLLHANYGYSFTAGLERGNIVGVQFHPEKSHKFGMKLLKNFATFYS